MVYLQLKPGIILGFRCKHVIEKYNDWNNIEATSKQIQCCRPIRRTYRFELNLKMLAGQN